MKKFFLFKFTMFLIIISNFVVGQNVNDPEVGCAPASERAKTTVEFFLKMSHLENERIQSGTNGVSVSEIKPVTDFSKCARLEQIIELTPKYASIDAEAKGKGRVRFYYQTNNFYYIFWGYNDNIIRTGFRKIFIILNSQFTVVGEFYI